MGIGIITLAFAAVMFGLLAVAVASNRRENPGVYFLWGAIFGPLGVCFALLEGRQCPECKRKVHDLARLCPFCQSKQPHDPDYRKSSRTMGPAST